MTDRTTASSTQTATMARVAGVLWACGGLMALAGPQSFRTPGLDVRAMLTLGVVSVVVGAALWLKASSVPRWSLYLAALGGGALITAAVHFSHDPRNEVQFLYLWPVMFTFYFFGIRFGLIQWAFAAAGYLAVLVLDPNQDPAGVRWMHLMGTALGAGLVVGFLKERNATLLAQLEEAAITDRLTGVRNRRGFDATLEREFERAERYGRPLALLMVDVDNFKSINDRFGHGVGDEALVHVARRLQAAVRSMDGLARVGGEEFVAVLPEQDADGGRVAGERLRRAVAEAPHPVVGTITVSVGVSSFPEHAGGPRDLVRLGDEALYQAKTRGRNRVEVSAPAAAPRAPHALNGAPGATAPAASTHA